MRLFLIRHGRQSDTRCNVDVGLAEAGRRQAELVAHRMEDWGIDHVVSSDMIRARQTAAVVGERLGRAVEVIPAFRELDFGEMHGLTDTEIGARFADFHREQRRMELDRPYPAGESATDVLARVLPPLRALTAEPFERAVLVTHGVVIRALAAFVLGAPTARWRLAAHTLENCSITEFRWHRDAAEFSLERLNDHAHLEHHPELLRSAWGVSEN